MLIEVKKALAEAEAEKPVPDIKEMQKNAAAARRQKIFRYIELEASRGENYFTADKHELDDNVKKELLTAGYEITLIGAATLKPTYLIKWE